MSERETLTIKLFGGLLVHLGDKPLTIPAGNVASLAVYLLLQPSKTHRREVVIEALFPDLEPGRGRKVLTDTLYRLTRILGKGRIASSSADLQLNREQIWVDAWHFDELISTGQYASAAALYHGELAPEFYADWIWPFRERYQRGAINALTKVAEHAESTFKWEIAKERYIQLAWIDPFNERYIRGAMRTLAALKEYGEALQHYQQLTRFLKEELQTKPERDTQILAEEIRQQTDRRQSLAIDQVGSAIATADQAIPAEMPFVGRQAERGAVLARVDAALQGNGGAIVIQAPSGMGKSRFLTSLLSDLRWRQADICSVTTPTQSDFQLEPLATLLSGLLSEERGNQMRWVLAENQRQILSPFFPAWQTETPQEIPPLMPEAEQQRISYALYALLRALTSIKPHIIMVDDFHHGGQGAYQLISGILPRLIKLPLALVITHTLEKQVVDPASVSPVEKILRSWELEGTAHRIDLPPLDHKGCQQLQEADPGFRHFQIEEMLQLSGGNLLHLSELRLATRQASDLSSLEALILRRVDQLFPEAVHALKTAALLQAPFDHHHWGMISGLEPLTLFRWADLLKKEGLLRGGPDNYQLGHRLMAQALIRSIDPSQAKKWHRRISQYLTQAPGRLAKKRLAFHLTEAGEWRAGAQLYAELGEMAWEAHLYPEAMRDLGRVSDLHHLAGETPPGPIIPKLIEGYQLTGDLDQAHQVLKRFWDMRANHDPKIQIQVALLKARYHAREGSPEESEIAIREGLELAIAQALLDEEVELLLERADLSLRYDPPSEAIEHFKRAVTKAQAISRLDLEGTALDGLAFATSYLGDPHNETLSMLEHAVELQRSAGDRLREARSMINLVSALQNAGQIQKGLDLARETEMILDEIGYRRGLATLRQSMGLLADMIGDLPQAEAFLEEAVIEFKVVGEPVGSIIAQQALGSVLEKQGLLQEANLILEKAVAASRSLGVDLLLGFTLQSYGRLLIEINRLEDGIDVLTEGASIWHHRKERLNEAKCKVGCGLAHLRLGQVNAAHEILTQHLALFHATQLDGEEAQRWYWDLYQLLQGLTPQDTVNGRAIIKAGYQKVARLCAEIDDPITRKRLVELTPINRQIVHEHDHLFEINRQLEVKLARGDVPLGRELASSDYVNLAWTILAPGDELFKSKKDRRHFQLQRLAQEAIASSGMPTDDDFAKALGVSRRTVIRDIAELKEKGIQIQTRRRGG